VPGPTDSATRPTGTPQRPAIPAGDSGAGGGNSDSGRNGGSGANSDAGVNNSLGASGVFSVNNRIGADAGANENGGGLSDFVSDSDGNDIAGTDADTGTNTANADPQTASVLTRPPESVSVGEAPAPVLVPAGETTAGGTADAYTIDYDGAGPFEVRIDISVEEFRELYFDGVIWAPGVDYEVRSGSTILTIPTARLDRVAEGSHRISAVFEGQSVNIDFVLQRTDTRGILAPISESGPITDPTAAKSFFLIPIAGFVLAAGAAAVLGTRILKQRKVAVKP
jgi:hypothetical protein